VSSTLTTHLEKGECPLLRHRIAED
jgi:hypothetical protein